LQTAAVPVKFIVGEAALEQILSQSSNLPRSTFTSHFPQRPLRCVMAWTRLFILHAKLGTSSPHTTVGLLQGNFICAGFKAVNPS